jgi:hypothetical protein
MYRRVRYVPPLTPQKTIIDTLAVIAHSACSSDATAIAEDRVISGRLE